MIAVKILLNCLNALAMLSCQLLKSLLAEDIFLKQDFLPVNGPISADKVISALLTEKELFAILRFTVLDYPEGATFDTLF